MRNLLQSVLACIVLAFIGAVPGRADDVDPKFGTYLKSPEMREAVTKAIRDQIADWAPDCNDVSISDESILTFLDPPQFASEGDKPASGSWIESIKVDACGSKHTHNVESIARDGNVETASLLNGSTHAGVELQNDAISSVLLAAGSERGDDCNDKHVTDTEFKTFEGDPIANAKDGPTARRWRETWTVSACKKEYVVPVIFTPDETGTGFAVEGPGASGDDKAKE